MSSVPPDPYSRIRIHLLTFCAIALLIIAFLTHFTLRAKPNRMMEAEPSAPHFAEKKEAIFGGEARD